MYRSVPNSQTKQGHDVTQIIKDRVKDFMTAV